MIASFSRVCTANEWVIITDCIREGADTVVSLLLRHEKWHVGGVFDPQKGERNECDDDNTKAKKKK
jgi:hypothetical protein